MRTGVSVVMICAFLVACDTPAPPIPSPRASPEPTVVTIPGAGSVTDLKPEVRIRLPDLDMENLVYLFYSDRNGSSRYMAPDQYPAAIELLQILSPAPETGQVPIETNPVSVLDIRLRDRTGLSLHHLGGTKANVYAGGQAAALDIPGLVEAMQKLAALPPEVSLDPTVTGLPEPIVILTGREAEEFRPASDPNPVPGLPEFPDFGLGLHGTVSPDGRRIAFTFGISDGTGLWMMDVDSGRYRHLHFFTGTRSLHWLTPDRLIFEWDHGVGCAAFDSDPPRIRSLNLPGEKHLFVLGVESPWITYRTVRGEKTVVQKVRIDGPGGCYLRPEPAAAGGEP